MRLWHKDLIKVLPREQLVAQWRECSAIAGSIQKNGTPNHLLVNYVLECPIEHFVWYSMYVRNEMTRRKYKTQDRVAEKIWSLLQNQSVKNIEVDYSILFSEYHDFEYLKICYYNLYEKHLRGGISKEDFDKIKKVYEENKNEKL